MGAYILVPTSLVTWLVCPRREDRGTLGHFGQFDISFSAQLASYILGKNVIITVKSIMPFIKHRPGCVSTCKNVPFLPPSN